MKPSKANIKGHLDKIREVIKSNKTAKQASLIRLLNPVLRGWVNYHRHIVAKDVFASNDAQVWSTLWQWAKRRHLNKGAGWIKRKYFISRVSRNWVFSAKEDSKCQKAVTLVSEADTPIQRHVKIRSDANPYDPKWEPYFEARWVKKIPFSSHGRKKLYRVWSHQNGNCSHCHDPITKERPWVVQYIVKKLDGGTDAASNLRMRHLSCYGAVYDTNTVVSLG